MPPIVSATLPGAVTAVTTVTAVTAVKGHRRRHADPGGADRGRLTDHASGDCMHRDCRCQLGYGNFDVFLTIFPQLLLFL